MRIRAVDPSDCAFLEDMLFEAFFWDITTARPTLASFRKQAEFVQVFDGWGRAGDRAIVAATHDGTRLGAAWFRLWTPEVHSYGFVDAGIPEIGMAVVVSHRSKGVGRMLLQALIETARADGFPAVSLSVSPANHARRLYEAEGFRKVGESGTSWTLLLSLNAKTSRAV
jgi:ribosomal protein S18 acetylase RimI-like enzyme